MGKGYILENLEEGLYRVRLEYNTQALAQMIAYLEERITALNELIGGLEDGPDKDMAQLRLAAAEKRKTYLEGFRDIEEPEVNAWCVDYTTDVLSGHAGTIEIPGEGESEINIQPGYDDGMAYDPGRDGQLTPIMGQTPAQALYNCVMLPGWQRWMPLHRYGTISGIDYDNDRCTVTLEAATSSAQGLNVNPADTALENVPIVYMNCDSHAFSDGDSVVVAFTNQSFDDPKVVGFRSHPVGCTLPYCSTMATPTECFVAPADIVNLEFEDVSDGSDYAADYLEENLSDGLDPAYEGVFGNIQYNDEEEKWTADYTVNGALCDQEQSELECPEICGHAFSCCFEWADDNPETVDQDDFVGISVVGGKSPYTWEVSGTGFSLGDLVSANRSNTLFADASACGTASITVTDDCGQSVTGYVRGTEGEWQTVETICCSSTCRSEQVGCYAEPVNPKTRYAWTKAGGALGESCGNDCLQLMLDPYYRLIEEPCNFECPAGERKNADDNLVEQEWSCP